MESEKKIKTGYLAAPGYEKPLMQELKSDFIQYGSLLLTKEDPVTVNWAQNIWYDPFIAHFESISEAAKILKDIQRNWAYSPFTEHRRAALIQEKLPYISNKSLQFPVEKENNINMGSWMLLDRHTLLASAKCLSPYPNGEIKFEECKEGPPSRAYLKLFEALTRCGKMPKPNEKCLEIGASPGGWTWVLANLGAEVLAVDRAVLSPNVMSRKEVFFHKGDAFSMTPQKLGKIDWIFSDVACYPEKLLEWVKLWLASGLCQNFICTLKFQGEDSYAVVEEFAKIPGSKLLHLNANKHELTWIKVN